MVLVISDWYAPVVACFIGAVGVSIVVVAFWSRRWPSVAGTVDISIYDTDEESDSNRKKLFLSYSYTVANRDYAGENVSPPLLADLRSDELSARRYREKMVVQVYYCPWAPSVSSLEHGRLGKSLALAISLIGLAVWLLVAGH